MSAKPFDVIVFGATSFVGQILTRHLWQRHGLDGEIRWAIAGRSRSKLESVRSGLGPGAAALPLLLADSGDEAALRGLCAQGRAIVSTVGPYALYGDTLVRVCAETGTDYCDLTGEVQWISRMLRAHEATAKASGARIVHCCGFDSIPSDLGVHFLQQQAQARFGQPMTRVKMRVRRLAGGMSGGTVASLINLFRELSANPSLAKDLGNPYLLAPDAPRQRQPDVRRPTYDSALGSWVAPFLMAAINTRIVHRSNALSGWSYGRDFAYDEAMMTGKGGKALAMATGLTGGLASLAVGAALSPTRWLLEKYVLPKPGEGPSPAEQESGHYDLRFHGTTADGQALVAQVTGDRDPGYGSTGKMLGEAVACLALDVPDAPGGFWTPATLLGDALQRRLERHAGLDFNIL